MAREGLTKRDPEGEAFEESDGTLEQLEVTRRILP